jgi:hypothetical protein
MSLPPTASIDPKDRIIHACVTWAHSETTTCPSCHGPALEGALDGKLVGATCHHCGNKDPDLHPMNIIEHMEFDYAACCWFVTYRTLTTASKTVFVKASYFATRDTLRALLPSL